MLVVISPAKSLNFETKPNTNQHTQPDFLNEAKRINAQLKKLKADDLIKLQRISRNLANLNVDRNLLWETPFSPDNAKQAILAFNGDVYDGINASTFSEKEFKIAQEKIRILSGLYGVLKPLDLMQAYRLEMGTKLSFGKYENLYQFWRQKITTTINKELKEKGDTLINLASQEYFKAIDAKKLKAEIITPEFKENKDGNYKMISFFAKKARGSMCRFIVQNNISNPEELKAFDLEGYYFNNELSKEYNWVFTRR